MVSNLVGIRLWLIFRAYSNNNNKDNKNKKSHKWRGYTIHVRIHVKRQKIKSKMKHKEIRNNFRVLNFLNFRIQQSSFVCHFSQYDIERKVKRYTTNLKCSYQMRVTWRIEEKKLNKNVSLVFSQPSYSRLMLRKDTYYK